MLPTNGRIRSTVITRDDDPFTVVGAAPTVTVTSGRVVYRA